MREVLFPVIAALLLTACSGHIGGRQNAGLPKGGGGLSGPVPRGQNVGNGGDFLRGLFDQGRFHAIRVLDRITANYFPRYLKDTLTAEEINWILTHKSELQKDLADSRHVWAKELPTDICPLHDKHTCACTLPSLKSNEIYLSENRCDVNATLPQVGQILLHETLHHRLRDQDEKFLGADEPMVYRTAGIIYGAWQVSATAQSPHLILDPQRSDEVERREILESTASAWTGERLVVWNPFVQNSPDAYDPATNQWTRLPVLGKHDYQIGSQGYGFPWLVGLDRRATEFPPENWRFRPMQSVLAGNRLVILFSDLGNSPWDRYPMAGFVYDLARGDWHPVTRLGAPIGQTLLEGRGLEILRIKNMVAAGDKVIVFGGGDRSLPAETGGIYDPAENKWEPITYRRRIPGEKYQSMVWASNRLVLWGQMQDLGPYDWDGWVKSKGLIYDPESKTWTEIAETPKYSVDQHFPDYPKAPFAGLNPQRTLVNGPINGEEIESVSIPSPQLPEFIANSAVVSDGRSVFIYGGNPLEHDIWRFERAGGILDPLKNEWGAISLEGAPLPYPFGAGGAPYRNQFLTAWDGHQIVIFGQDIRFYSPEAKRWTISDQQIGQLAFKARRLFWTGVELIAWDNINQGLIFVP